VVLVLSTAGLALSLERAADGPAPSALPSADTDISVRIDLNRATAAELESLPAVGPRRAQAIISDREERGPFRSIEDLDRVPGIGNGTIARIRGYLIVTPPADPPPR
jgi:competence protein ComEA